MTATFEPDLSDAISRVRMTIGDTVVAKAQIQDETITALLVTYNDDETKVAIALCENLAAKWASITDAQLDNQEIKASHMSANYLKLADRLRSRSAASVGVSATYSGIMVSGVGDCRGPDLTLAGDCCYEP